MMEGIELRVVARDATVRRGEDPDEVDRPPFIDNAPRFTFDDAKELLRVEAFHHGRRFDQEAAA